MLLKDDKILKKILTYFSNVCFFGNICGTLLWPDNIMMILWLLAGFLRYFFGVGIFFICTGREKKTYVY